MLTLAVEPAIVVGVKVVDGGVDFAALEEIAELITPYPITARSAAAAAGPIHRRRPSGAAVRGVE